MLLIIGGCSADQQDATPQEESAAADAAVPDVSRTAPGVAFTMACNFALPVGRIAGVQQAHAEACAALGADRCRVTGMDFRQQGEDEASGRLDLLLAPEVALRFSSQASDLVRQASGSIERADVSGEDDGGRIDASHRSSRTLKEELARVEARLATGVLTRESRPELEARRQEIQRAIAGSARQFGSGVRSSRSR
jgi:hypothetical protein